MALLKIAIQLLEDDRGTDLVCALMDHFYVYKRIGFDNKDHTLIYRVERAGLPTDDTEVYVVIEYFDDKIHVHSVAPVVFDINSCLSVTISVLPIPKKTVP